MNIEQYNLWNRLTFRTVSYRKNFDLINKNESFITEHSGIISEINISEQLPPVIVGEYGYSIWDIGLAKKFNIDITKLFKKYRFEDTYSELLRLKKEDKFDFHESKKIILLHNLVLHPNFKKKGITEEFIESIYRNYHDDQNVIIALVKPLQYNEIDNEYFYQHNIVRVKKDLSDPTNYTDMKASNYYSLDDLKHKTDAETNEIKLYALASRLGFKRMDDTYLFLFYPYKVIERMNNKIFDLKTLDV